MIRIKRLLKSFKHSFKGLKVLIKKEQNFRVHLIAAIIAIVLATYFDIKIWEWCIIILMIALVLLLEMFNTIFERLSDLFKPRMHDFVLEIKDVSSAIVFIGAVVSIIIGLIIFVPYFIQVFS